MMPFFAGIGAVMLVEFVAAVALIFYVWKRTLKW